MDNASKALIMAGAILIAVALVGVGVYLYSSASGMMNSGVDEINSAEIMTKNSKIEKYEGIISGTELRTLMRQLNTDNANEVYPTNLTITGDMITVGSDGQMTAVATGTTALRNSGNYLIVLEYDSNGWIDTITATRQNT